MTLHPQAVAYLATLPVGGDPGRYADVREAQRAAALAAPRVALHRVEDVDADGVPCRLYVPAPDAPVALYVHGGGWVLHDLEMHDAFCRTLADTTGWALLAVDYRRAPEHPYPAPLDDVQAAASWLREHATGLGLDARHVPGIGDSSGANLLAGLAVRDRTALDRLVLLYPPTDRRAAGGSMDDEDGPGLEAAGMAWFWDAYAPGALADRPDVSVLHADLAGFPPTWIATCEHDVLRDQGEAFAAALASAGVDVESRRVLGVPHSFWRMPDVFDAARATVRDVAGLLAAVHPRLQD